MFAGQGCEGHRCSCRVIDPDSLFNLGTDDGVMSHSDVEDLGLDDETGFVGGPRREAAEGMCVVGGQNQPKFLIQLTTKRSDGAFAVFDLAAGLHVPFGSCLADQEQMTCTVIDKGGCDPDFPSGFEAHDNSLPSRLYARSPSIAFNNSAGVASALGGTLIVSPPPLAFV